VASKLFALQQRSIEGTGKRINANPINEMIAFACRYSLIMSIPAINYSIIERSYQEEEEVFWLSFSSHLLNFLHHQKIGFVFESFAIKVEQEKT
jgi:hypothetical protein